MELADRCAVVTGGGHGIGRALCERLARDGARVVVADLHAERAEKIAARVGGVAFVGDVGDPAVVSALVDRAEAAYGPVHVFCSNAGIGDRGPDLASTPDEVRAVVDVNLLAHVWAAQRVLPAMVEEGAGYLVQTISSAALITGTVTDGLHAHQARRAGVRRVGRAQLRAPRDHRHLPVPERGEHRHARAQRRRRRRVGTVGVSVAANIGDVVEPELVADMALDAMAQRRFLVLPHPRVGESFLRKAGDYDRWLEGTNRRLRRMRRRGRLTRVPGSDARPARANSAA